jgi:SSS family solute:Na+ symporter
MGLFRLAIDTPVKLMEGFRYEQGTFLWVVNNIFFQYYSILILLVCVAVALIVSYATEVPSYEKITGLTFATRTEEHKKESRASWTRGDVFASALVLALILCAYLYFVG